MGSQESYWCIPFENHDFKGHLLLTSHKILERFDKEVNFIGIRLYYLKLKLKISTGHYKK